MLHTNIYTHTTINAAFHHDKRAMEALYRETYGTVYSSVRMMLSDEYAVEDIVQDAFIKGFQSLDQLSDPQKYPSWMKRILSAPSFPAKKARASWMACSCTSKA